MLAWWDALALAEQIFYCIAIPATLILLIQTIMLFFGMDEDGQDGDGGFEDGEFEEADVLDEDLPEDMEADGGDGLRVLTLRGIVAFFVVFGWIGAAMTAANVSLWIVVPVAAVSGFAMMLLLAVILKAALGLRNDGTADNRNAIGASGRVHLTIPPKRRGEGKVHIMLQGAYVERSAVTDEEEAIPTGSEVVVLRLSGQTDLVVRRK